MHFREYKKGLKIFFEVKTCEKMYKETFKVVVGKGEAWYLDKKILILLSYLEF